MLLGAHGGGESVVGVTILYRHLGGRKSYCFLLISEQKCSRWLSNAFGKLTRTMRHVTNVAFLVSHDLSPNLEENLLFRLDTRLLSRLNLISPLTPAHAGLDTCSSELCNCRLLSDSFGSP